MMTEDDENLSLNSQDKNYILYRDRVEWKDVIPVPQDDGPFSVVQIAYSEKFKDVYDYFRAILKADERSERALELTTDALEQNSANYTVWNYRRILMKSLNKNLDEEMKYISDIIVANPKNYQVWHHRRVIVEWQNSAAHELEFTKYVLKKDSKNYHAWQHRQWVINHFDLWEGELEYVNELLNEDVRNNSAWNQKYFIISHTTNFSDEVIDVELKYSMDKIGKVPHNESAWNYLRGILQDKNKQNYPELLNFCENLYKENIRSAYLLGFLIECWDEFLREITDNDSYFQGKSEGESIQSDEDEKKMNRESLLKRAVELSESLADKYDTIRAEYWKYISRSLSIQHGSSLPNTILKS